MTKSLAMYYDNRIRMINERRSAIMSSIMNGGPTMPYLRLTVRREHLIDDALVGVGLTALSFYLYCDIVIYAFPCRKRPLLKKNRSNKSSLVESILPA